MEKFLKILKMEKVVYDKKVLTLDEKINLLKERGLKFLDEEKAKQKILHIGYFRLTGYLKYFQNKETDLFFPEVTFEKVMNLYNFDRKLRILTLDAIEKIEVSLKSVINYEMYKDFGFFWYLDENLFNLKNEKYKNIYEKFLEKVEEKQEKSSSIFIKEFFKKYENKFIPSYMLFEELTIGEVSTIFKILKTEFKQNISNKFGLYHLDLDAWLNIFVNVRNICAHHSRLWNKVLRAKPRKKDKIFGEKFIFEENGEVKGNFFNSYLIINYFLLKISKNFGWKENLEKLFNDFSEVDIEKMGFDKNWKNF